MRNHILVLSLFSCITLFGQLHKLEVPFSEIKFGAYGGVNFGSSVDRGGVFSLEAKTNLISNLELVGALQYRKSYANVNFNVKNMEHLYSGGSDYYNVTYTNVSQIEYDIYSAGIDFRYMFPAVSFTPYLAIGGGTNYIFSKDNRKSSEIKSYSTIESISFADRVNYNGNTDNMSIEVLFGAGVLFPVTRNVNLDVRYFYVSDSRIVNTHNVIVGIEI